MIQNHIVAFVVRVAMALLFVVTGVQKLIHPERLAPMFDALGLPERLALAVGAFEVVTGVLFVAAVRLRLIAPALAAWCIFTGLVGHPFWSDPAQLSSFLKNVGLSGAFLLFASGSTSSRRAGHSE